MLQTLPAVFVVGRSYQIMVQVKSEALMYVRIGDKTYYDDSNGIMNSLYPIHRVCVPMEVLDRENKYTVCIRPVTTRKPYFTDTKNRLNSLLTLRRCRKRISACTIFPMPTMPLIRR